MRRGEDGCPINNVGHDEGERAGEGTEPRVEGVMAGRDPSGALVLSEVEWIRLTMQLSAN